MMHRHRAYATFDQGLAGISGQVIRVSQGAQLPCGVWGAAPQTEFEMVRSGGGEAPHLDRRPSWVFFVNVVSCIFGV